MSIVNFAIPKQLEHRVEKAIKQKGFLSKAEFFRMATMFFLDYGTSTAQEEKRTEFLIHAIRKEIETKYKNRKLPTIKQQLSTI